MDSTPKKSDASFAIDQSNGNGQPRASANAHWRMRLKDDDKYASDDAPSAKVHLSGSAASVATLCNSAVGAGVLSLPYAISHAGLLGGVLLCIAVGLCEMFTLYVLTKFADHTGQPSYSLLVRATLGSTLSSVLAVVLVVATFGSCTAYLMIIGDTFSSLISAHDQLEESIQGSSGVPVNRTTVVLLLGFVVIMPMCFAKRLGALSHMSSLAVAGFVYTALVVIGHAIGVVLESEDPFKNIALFKLDIGMLSALPILTFGFNCHANGIAIFHEISDKPDSLVPWCTHAKGKSVRLSNMTGVIFTGIMFIMAGYIGVGIAGYLSHPLDMSSNILNTLPVSPLVQIARFVIGVVVLVHYPVTYHPGREAFKDVLGMAGWEWASRSQYVSYAYTIVFALGTMAVAITVEELGQVISLIGGTGASFVIFFNPGLMLLKNSYHKLDGVAADQKGSEMEPLHPKTSKPESQLVSKLPKGALLDGKEEQLVCFSPGFSFVAGVLLVALSIGIFVVTIITVMRNASVHR